MEVTYFVISIIEIILTVYLVFVILKTDKAVTLLKNKLEILIPEKMTNYKKFALTLSSLNKILKLYEKYTKELTKYKKIYKAIENLKSAILVLAFALGLKNHKKLNLKKLIKL